MYEVVHTVNEQVSALQVAVDGRVTEHARRTCHARRVATVVHQARLGDRQVLRHVVEVR